MSYRTASRLRPARTTLRRAYSTPPSRLPPRPIVPVDSLCIPLRSPYSIASFIPSPTPLSRATLTKLHRLAALNPPTTEEGWAELEDLGGLVAIMEGVRGVDTSALGKGIVDARVRERGVESGEQEVWEEEVGGRSLLELAEVREGDYYIVRTPEGIRTKKRGGAKSVGAEDE